ERELELAPAPGPPGLPRLVAVLRQGREPQPYLSQQLAPREAEAVAPAHPHEVLDRAALELGGRAAHQLADAPERAVAPALGRDGGRRLLAPVPDEPEPDPHRSRFPFPVSRFPFLISRFPFLISRFPFLISRFPFPVSRFPFYGAPPVAPVHVWKPDLDAVAL